MVMLKFVPSRKADQKSSKIGSMTELIPPTCETQTDLTLFNAPPGNVTRF